MYNWRNISLNTSRPRHNTIGWCPDRRISKVSATDASEVQKPGVMNMGAYEQVTKYWTIRRATGTRRVRSQAPVLCSRVPALRTTGLQNYGPVRTPFGVLTGGLGDATPDCQTDRIHFKAFQHSIPNLIAMLIVFWSRKASNICPKSIKNKSSPLKSLPKTVQNQNLGAVWAALGRLVDDPLLLGISGQPPGRLLGSSWAVLEASWAPVGRLLGRFGHQVRASWRQLGGVLVG